MEIPCHTEDDSLTLRDTLLLIGPLAGEFNRSFDSFGTSVHWQNHVVAKHGSNFLCVLPEDRVIECPRRQRELLSLLDEGGDNSRVAMTLSVQIVRQI